MAIFKASTNFEQNFNEFEDFLRIFVDSLNFSLKIRWNFVKSTKILFVDSLNSFRWFRWFVEFVEKINENKKQQISFENSSTEIKNNEFFSIFFGALSMAIANLPAYLWSPHKEKKKGFRSIGRDFADGVRVAKIIKVFYIGGYIRTNGKPRRVTIFKKYFSAIFRE